MWSLINVSSNLCMYICMYVCIYVCMYACITFRGSSTTPRSGRDTYIASGFTPILPFLRAVEFLFVVITSNCPQHCANNYVHLLTTSCVFLRLP